VTAYWPNLPRCTVLTFPVSDRCVFCDQAGESSSHLFLHCVTTFHVWSLVCGWLEINFITPQSLFQHFECWNGEIDKKRFRKGYWLVWHASLWAVWKARNDRIFNNIIKEPVVIVEEIKVLLWRWVLSRLKSPPCLFYEWFWNPKVSLLRYWGSVRGFGDRLSVVSECFSSSKAPVLLTGFVLGLSCYQFLFPWHVLCLL